MRRVLLLAAICFPALSFAEMTNLGADVVMPSPHIGLWSGIPSWEGQTIDANGEKAAWVFRYGSTQAVNKIGFQLGFGVAGGTLTWRVETVTASNGQPSGTLYCADSSGTVTSITGTTVAYYESDAAVADCTPTFNDFVAIVVQRDAGTFNGGIAVKQGDFDSNFPYTMGYTTSWSKDFGPAALAIKHPDGTYARFSGLSPFMAVVSQSFSGPSTPDTYGNIITFPFKVRVKGVLVWMDPDNDFFVKAYKDGAEVATISVDSNQNTATNGAGSYFLFNTTFTVEANESFRVATKGSFSSIVQYIWDAGSATQLSTAFDFGAIMYQSTASDPTEEASWTQNTSRMVAIYPVIDQIDLGSGGSARSHSFVGP